MTSRTVATPDSVLDAGGEGPTPPPMGRDSASGLWQRSARALFARLLRYAEAKCPSTRDKFLVGVWALLYFFTFPVVFNWRAHPAAVGPLLWATFGVVGWFGGAAVILLISHRPTIGALVVLAVFLPFLLVQRYWPGIWFTVPVLLFAGLSPFLPLAYVAVRRAPPDHLGGPPAAPH